MNDFQLTPTSLTLISVSVGAIAAILGHITAGLLNILREYYMDQRKIKRAEVAAAIETVVALESMMAICHNILKCERLNVAPDDPLDCYFECELPSIEAINLIAYRDIESNIALEVAKLKSDIHSAVIFLSSLDMDPPDYGHAVEQRKRTFAIIGLRINVILNKILISNQMEVPVRTSQYDPGKDFKEALETALSAETMFNNEMSQYSGAHHA